MMFLLPVSSLPAPLVCSYWIRRVSGIQFLWGPAKVQTGKLQKAVRDAFLCPGPHFHPRIAPQHRVLNEVERLSQDLMSQVSPPAASLQSQLFLQDPYLGAVRVINLLVCFNSRVDTSLRDYISILYLIKGRCVLSINPISPVD